MDRLHHLTCERCDIREISSPVSGLASAAVNPGSGRPAASWSSTRTLPPGPVEKFISGALQETSLENHRIARGSCPAILRPSLKESSTTVVGESADEATVATPRGVRRAL